VIRARDPKALCRALKKLQGQQPRRWSWVYPAHETAANAIGPARPRGRDYSRCSRENACIRIFNRRLRGVIAQVLIDATAAERGLTAWRDDQGTGPRGGMRFVDVPLDMDICRTALGALKWVGTGPTL